jgi:predicted Zn-dependent protease
MRRAAALVLLLLLLAGCDDLLVPPPADRAALVAAEREIAAAPPPRPQPRRPAEERAMLERVVPRLLRAAQPFCQAEQGRACQFQFALSPAAEANAYASGRDLITVTAGMLRLVDSEDELAAVIAHEIAHHIAGHIAETGWRAQLGAIAGATLGRLASEALGIDIGLSQLGAQAGQYAARISYSKAQEREADYLGAYILARAGFDMGRAGGLWAKLTHLSGDATTSLLDSHPAGPERLAIWRRTAEEIAARPEAMPHRSR